MLQMRIISKIYVKGASFPKFMADFYRKYIHNCKLLYWPTCCAYWKVRLNDCHSDLAFLTAIPKKSWLFSLWSASSCRQIFSIFRDWHSFSLWKKLEEGMIPQLEKNLTPSGVSALETSKWLNYLYLCWWRSSC